MSANDKSGDEGRSFVFVLMPFAEKFNEVYEGVLKPTIEELGYDCIRADEIAAPGNINRDIVEMIHRSEFVLADLTGSNPNVMYELGLSHAIARVTIIITQDARGLPFDVSPYRVITYEQSIKGASELKKKLRSWIENPEMTRKQASNPYSDFLVGEQSRDSGANLLSPVECFTSLTKSLETMVDKKADEEAVKLVRAIPTEMTNDAFSRQLGPDSLHVKKYEELIGEYVERADLDDETVFGCPPNLQCLKETLSQIKRSYFTRPADAQSPNRKEVSAIGFHPYLRSYSLFLLGKMKVWEEEPREYHTGFIFFLNKNGVPVEGIRVSEGRALRILLHLWHVLLEEIDHVEGGVQFSADKVFVLTQKNHRDLFREKIGDPMIEAFRRLNNIDAELEVSDQGDEVEVLV